MNLRHTVSTTTGKHYYFTLGNRRITKEMYDNFHRFLDRNGITADLHVFRHKHKRIANWVFDYDPSMETPAS